MNDLANLLAPLFDFLTAESDEMPSVVSVDGGAMEEPYRSLLVHQGDMTGTLSRFYQEEIGLEVLESQHQAELYRRRVLLHTKESGQVVEYGGICIHLAHYPEPVQARILSGKEPLGTILNTERIDYRSQPQEFISIGGTAAISRIFDPGEPAAKPDGSNPEENRFYGRCNILTTGDGRLLAEIVEILPRAGNLANRGATPST